MKRILILLLVAAGFTANAQSYTGDFLNARKRLTVRGSNIDTIKNDTTGLDGRTKTLMTADAVYDFINGRTSAIEPAWSLEGSNISYGKYIGTKNNFDVRFFSNGVERMRLDSASDDLQIGLGTNYGSIRIQAGSGNNYLQIYGNTLRDWIISTVPSGGGIITYKTGGTYWQNLSSTTIGSNNNGGTWFFGTTWENTNTRRIDITSLGGTAAIFRNGSSGDIFNIGDASITANDAGGNVDFRIEGDTDPNLFFTDASTDRIGIGTNTPGSSTAGSYKLDVNGVANFREGVDIALQKKLRFKFTDAWVDGMELYISNTPQAYISTPGIPALNFVVNNGGIMSLNSGNVRILTTSVTHTLEVNGTIGHSGGFGLYSLAATSTAAAPTYSFYGNLNTGIYSGGLNSNTINFSTGGTLAATIKSNKVGIGTGTPDSTLHVVGGLKFVNGTQGLGKVLTSDANGGASWQTPGNTDEGSYTPTITNGTNVAASTSYTTRWYRVGDMIYVFGELEIDATSAGNSTDLSFTLPVGSTLSNTYDLAGTAAHDDGTSIRIYADTVNGRAQMKFVPNTATANKYSFHFSYLYTAP